jgi:hypothetical protein
MAIPRNLANIAPHVAGSSGGITGLTFNATQSASAGANTLDDYEEGVFTVTMTPQSSGTITVDTSQDDLSYTKIGRIVTITGIVSIASIGSPVGSYVTIGNLPFSSENLSGLSGASSTGMVVLLTAGWFIHPVRLFELTNTLRWQIDASTINAGAQIEICLSYVAS